MTFYLDDFELIPQAPGESSTTGTKSAGNRPIKELPNSGKTAISWGDSQGLWLQSETIRILDICESEPRNVKNARRTKRFCIAADTSN